MKVNVRLLGSLRNIVSGRVAKARATTNKGIVMLWRRAVSQSGLSGKAKDRYSRSIVPYKTKVGAYLDDNVAKLLEAGWKRFDMKKGLLAGRPYRRIPLLVGGKRVVRTVSVNSPASSWVHPGFRGARVADRVTGRLLSVVVGALKRSK